MIQITYRHTRRLSMRIVRNGDVHVSAPIGMPKADVEQFIEKNREWIAEARKRNSAVMNRRAAFFDQLPLRTDAQIEDAIRRMGELIDPLVSGYAAKMNVQPGAVYFKAMISQWGVCNVKDHSICFSAYLLLLPDWCVEPAKPHERFAEWRKTPIKLQEPSWLEKQIQTAADVL